MKLTRLYVPLAVLAACLIMAAGAPAMAAPAKSTAAKDELTFSAALSNPNNGDTTYNLTGEYLVGTGIGNLLVGPSVSLFDLGNHFQGGSVGLSGELGVG